MPPRDYVEEALREAKRADGDGLTAKRNPRNDGVPFIPADEPPPVDAPFECTYAGEVESEAPIAPSEPTTPLPDNFPLKVGDWLKRKDLVEPDFLLGHIFSTTTRALMWAATGLGKTLLGLSLAWVMASGGEILGWKAKRKARVLYVDGEMSRRLLLDRLKAECERAGVNPDDLDLFVFSHEDIPNFMPLNTPTGQKQIEAIIKRIGGVDFVIFDNIMSLTVGDLREGKSWSDTMAWVKSLTKRLIGQLWIHHTGHDETRSYGDKSKEWQLDLVFGLTEVKREDTDVSFKLEFDKARERTPATRVEFEARTIALVNDRWVSSAATAKQGNPSPLGRKFLETLQDALAGDETATFQGWKAVTNDAWRRECVTRGLINPAKPVSARTLFDKYKRELIGHNLIGCHNELVWLR